MKSVMQSAWLMTVAFGNLIVVIIAEAQIFDKQVPNTAHDVLHFHVFIYFFVIFQWKEFFLFAGLMFLG
jgi:dipeptide/tripeptide permease